MAKFDFAAGSKKADGTVVSKKDKLDPQSYVFIGRDKFRNEERTPQDWRKLHIVLARMAAEADKSITQNIFGLTIMYDALEECEKVAKKALGKDYESEVERHWKDALAEDKRRAEQSAKRMAEKEAKNAQDVEAALKKSVATKK